MEYFYAAILAWLEGDEAAGIAALAAGMTIERRWRPKVLLIFTIFPEEQQEQLHRLAVALVSQDEWTIEDLAAVKKQVSESNKDYYRAMCNWYGKANPEVFFTKHPALQVKRDLVRNLASLVTG